MYELRELLDSGRFTAESSAMTRVALLHRSFRVLDRERGIGRKAFAAHFPPLGLLNLVQSLRDDASLGLVSLPEFQVFDEESFFSEDELFHAVQEYLAGAPRRILASSTYTFSIDGLERFLSRFDRRETLLLLGGAHVTVAPESDFAHILVRGEGGAAMRHILNALGTTGLGQGEGGEGLCFKLDGVVRRGRAVFDRSLETVSSPGFAYNLLESGGDGQRAAFETNLTRLMGQRPQIYVCTQSCRARCTFCSTYLVHGHSKARPVPLIERDLAYLTGDLGHDCIEFHDDDLLQHPRFDDLLTVLERIGVPWFCFGRAETIDGNVAERMARAGCRRIFLGIEAMDQPTLDYFNKQTSVAHNREGVIALAAAGIDTVAGFIIGAPHHTVEGMLTAFDTFLELPLYGIACSILSPDPGTVEFRRAVNSGGDMLAVLGGDRHASRVKPDLERFGALQPAGLPTVCEAVDKAELNRMHVLMETAFYHRWPVYERLVEGRSDRQVARIQAFYAYLRTAFLNLDMSSAHPLVRDRAHALRTTLESDWHDAARMCG
ncbi:B12-binding domain-containing radical SAM protein [Azospirillum agricola]|uniref:B12-binding domain-containing radical SAM protein n=1 Tax=Azospirillum agricola TaxID=1720247 RepID=UPI000A0F0024|nr:radical SAM protein [Azospirillum agricola]SMH28565.1 anaerobic Mg-protoporphyrin IX monomethyl ester oxidative cyclase [Azospirillum lipoferum]